MSRSVARPTTYKERYVPQIYKQPSAKIKIIEISPHKTIFHLQKQQGMKIQFADNNQFVPLTIYGFGFVDSVKCILMDFWCAEGTGRKEFIRKENVIGIFESWFGAVVGYEEKLKKSRWTNITELNKFSSANYTNNVSTILDDNTNNANKTLILYESPWIHCNHIRNCNCNDFKITFSGSVTQSDFNQYLTMDPEHYFESNDMFNGNDIASGWVHEIQLSDDNQFKEIDIEEIILSIIRREIAAGSSKYLTSEFLSFKPLDIDMSSCFFGKQHKLNEYAELINNFAYIPKSISYSYLIHIINETLKDRIDDSSVEVEKVVIFGNPRNRKLYGSFVDEYTMEYGIIHNLEIDDIELKYDFDDITILLPIEFVLNTLKVDKIIKRNIDKSITELIGSEIVLKYHRTDSIIYGHKFSYCNKNSELVELQNAN